ncbi:MAG: siphovirus Gp157 family protein [Oscillospiraceae bacterium]|nr:siphovirus Gp157 family protein [Oscillospiraceae bacterium]
MSIYDDVLAAEKLINECYDLETGEVFEEQEEQAKRLRDEILAQGMEALCKVRANFKSDIDALKAEEKRIAEKRKVLENKTESLERYIKDILHLSGQDKVKAGTFTVSLRMSEAVKLADNFENKDFGTYEFKADKKAIKEALKSGLEIDGAEIVCNLNLQVR